MNYDFVKQLKDAGLVVRNHSLVPRKILHNENWSENIGEPTLHELIEACGEGFWSLMKAGSSWTAESGIGSDYREFGLTAEEAVARLWLVLNKKA